MEEATSVHNIMGTAKFLAIERLVSKGDPSTLLLTLASFSGAGEAIRFQNVGYTRQVQYLLSEPTSESGMNSSQVHTSFIRLRLLNGARGLPV